MFNLRLGVSRIKDKKREHIPKKKLLIEKIVNNKNFAVLDVLLKRLLKILKGYWTDTYLQMIILNAKNFWKFDLKTCHLKTYKKNSLLQGKKKVRNLRKMNKVQFQN